MNNIIITISRQYGSGGRNIGKLIANKLNINFYDKEFIEIVAKKTGMNKQYLENMEEKFTNDNLFFSAFHKEHFSSPFSGQIKYSTLDKMFEIQSEVVKDIANKGNCVIIGRCANFILKNTKHKCFNVFIHAHNKNRIERIKKEYGIYGVKMEEAETQLINTDKYRSNYYKYYTGMEWGDMVNYNLTIDSGYFSDENICNIIIDAAQKKNINT
ncbi:cytidylate kinase-like family protein [Brachyspira hampsonii]|uniref:Cytidylate kinase n=2 Tax=Brachyspira hampsonii TaxID=1287055 RepID=A0A2U4EXB0_9SPIR|nr:cytidylate kinase-like family protein [Brachyspira hampsonii]EKV55872.1 cytidylate kinase [Brachyspira hampsonii 30446]MBW5390848.1 cytidylate kinase-like family protein [Brachyspira hampsonii]OEJ13396.1 cytidylate kinase [Brachyspira hampsonii]